MSETTGSLSPTSDVDPLDAVDFIDESLSDDLVEETVLSSTVEFDGAVWDIRRDRVSFGGTEMVREFVDHTGAVAVLALDDEDRVMLIKQYRHPISRRDWELPAGLRDDEDELPLAAAKRELAEEVDLTAKNWNVLTEFFTTPGGSNEFLRVYLARGIDTTGQAFERVDEEAQIETRWVTLDDVVEAVLDRRITNSILSIAVLAAAAAKARDWETLGDAGLDWPHIPKASARS